MSEDATIISIIVATVLILTLISLMLFCVIFAFSCGVAKVLAAGEAIEECPDGQVKYDIPSGTYVYGENPDINNYGVHITGTGPISWTVKTGCHHCAICISADDGLDWQIYPPHSGTHEGGDHIVFWGGCQVPCQLPDELARAYVPLVTSP